MGEAVRETMCYSSGKAKHQRNSVGSTREVCKACMGHSRVLRDEAR
jgi:hypothetical protein